MTPFMQRACFAPFPFPDATEEQKVRIRHIAESLDAHRKQRQQLHPKLTLTDMYAVLEKIPTGEDFTAKEKRVYEQVDMPMLLELHKQHYAAWDAYIVKSLDELKDIHIPQCNPQYKNRLEPNYKEVPADIIPVDIQTADGIENRPVR